MKCTAGVFGTGRRGSSRRACQDSATAGEYGIGNSLSRNWVVASKEARFVGQGNDAACCRVAESTRTVRLDGARKAAERYRFTEAVVAAQPSRER